MSSPLEDAMLYGMSGLSELFERNLTKSLLLIDLECLETEWNFFKKTIENENLDEKCRMVIVRTQDFVDDLISSVYESHSSLPSSAES